MNPKDFENSLRELSPSAIKALKKLLASRDAKMRLEAIKVVFERGYGKTASTGRDPWDEEFEGIDLNEIFNDEEK